MISFLTRVTFLVFLSLVSTFGCKRRNFNAALRSNLSGDSVFKFANGNTLSIGQSGALVFRSEEIEKQIATCDQFIVIPKSVSALDSDRFSEVNSVWTMKLVASQIAMLVCKDKVVSVHQSGRKSVFTAPVSAFRRPTFFTFASDEFMTMSIQSPEKSGGYFIVSNGKNIFSYALENAAFGKENDDKLYYSGDAANTGKLKIPISNRSLDLANFDKECFFPANRAKREFTNQEGVQQHSRDFVKGFLTDLNTMQSNTNFVPDLDFEEALKGALLIPKPSGVVVLGEAGAGKTASVYEFIKRASLGLVQEMPQTWTYFQLKNDELSAGSMYTGIFASRVAAIKAYGSRGDIIYVADEIHTFEGLGTHKNESAGFLEKIKPELASGDLRMIAMTTEAEWNELISRNPALQSRFTVVSKRALSSSEIQKVLEKYFSDKDVDSLVGTKSQQLREYMIDLSSRFDAAGSQPRKVLRLASAIAASRNNGNWNTPIAIGEVQKIASKLYNLEPYFFDPELRKIRLTGLAAKLNEKISGMGRVKDVLINQSYLAFGDIDGGNVPTRRMFLFGPPGVGKTEILRQYAEAMQLPFERINMADFNGYGNGNSDQLKKLISNALTKNAFTIFLLDELEKAPISIQNSLLDVLDSGKLTVQTGEGISQVLNAKNAAFYFASNAGQQVVNQVFQFLRSKDENLEETGQKLQLDKIENQKWLADIMKDNVSEPLLSRLKPYVLPVLPPFKEQLLRILTFRVERQKEWLLDSKGLQLKIENQNVYLANAVDALWAQSSFDLRGAIGKMKDEIDLAVARKVVDKSMVLNPTTPVELEISL
jgi:ATP-dependent Clp protease ATP-binding subunit ClpA